MNSQEPPNWERKLQELEAELSKSQTAFNPEERPITVNISQLFQMLVYQALHWFNGLAQVGKIVTIVGVGIVALAVLQAVVQLVSLLMTLLVLGGLGFVGYKFFQQSKSNS